MGKKQRAFLLMSVVLPVIALAAYLFLTPVKVVEASCPGGTMYAGYSCPLNHCNSGSGYCYGPGSSGIYVFCNGGTGYCSTTGSCVSCPGGFK